MKKIILLTIFLASGVFTFAQPFFSEDFSSGIPGNWTNIDNAGSGVVWRVTTTGASGSQLDSVGTSSLNGYLILDSDSAFGMQCDANLTTATINCAGHDTVHLVFNEYFAGWSTSVGTVQVSNDSITWIDVHSVDTTTSNPNTPDIDISSYAANQATVYVRFRYLGSSEYWWFIDDVKLYEQSSTDIPAIPKGDPVSSIYPNPSNDKVTITFSQSHDEKHILLSNVLGETQMEEKNFSGEKFTLDVSALSKGIYFVKVSERERVSIHKIILY